MDAEGEDGGSGTKPGGGNYKQTDSDFVRRETFVEREQRNVKETDDQKTSAVQDDNSEEKDADVKHNDVTKEDFLKTVGNLPDRDKLKKLDTLALSMTSPNDERNGKRRSPTEANGRKRKHRRKQKGGKHHPRKWKPYDKLTWEERKILEERESKRACKKRESQFASGQAMAPYNTTQFLMEQHEPEESELHLDDSIRHARERTLSHRMDDHHGNNGSGSGSGEGSTDDYDSNDEEEIFLERDFTKAYEQYQAERLQGMTKEELVREYLGMEGEVEDLKRQLKEVNRRYSSESNSGSLPQTPLVGLQSPHFDDHKAKQSRMLNLQSEIQKLQEENVRLAHENKKLRLRRTSSENDLAGSLNL